MDETFPQRKKSELCIIENRTVCGRRYLANRRTHLATMRLVTQRVRIRARDVSIFSIMHSPLFVVFRKI